MSSRLLAAIPAALVLGACASAPPPVVPPSPAGADGCGPIRAEVAANPEAPVDQPAAPVAMKPAPVRRPVPANVLRADATPELSVTVVVDTLGKADMSTFTVLQASHKWYADGAKAAIAKWTFTPAVHRGCKVQRPYKFGFKGG